MKTYRVKSIFGPTIEGEGKLSGTSVFFLRLEGCNIWDGRPETKADSACPYCDTNFINGKEMTVLDILLEFKTMANFWPEVEWIVISGGEPCLQIDEELIKRLKEQGFKISIESNGTVANSALRICDLVTFSPKKSQIATSDYQVLKLLFPHPDKNLHPDRWGYLRDSNVELYLQPVWDKNYKQNVKDCTEYIYKNPQWKLSLQVHKIIGLE